MIDYTNVPHDFNDPADHKDTPNNKSRRKEWLKAWYDHNTYPKVYTKEETDRIEERSE